jgi:hypothetical protein
LGIDVSGMWTYWFLNGVAVYEGILIKTKKYRRK